MIKDMPLDYVALAKKVRIRETTTRTHWTRDETRDAVILRRAGFTYRQIALRLGRTDRGVQWQLGKLRQRGLYD